MDITGGAKGNVGGIPRLNQPPLCNANGPYDAECAGDVTVIHLDGTQSSDPDNDNLIYTWSTDCTGASIDDPNIADPTITIPTGGQCNLSCNVTLVVSDGTHTSTPCIAQVTISDTNAPSIVCDTPEVTISCGQPTDTDAPTVGDDCDPDPIVTHEDTITPGTCAQSYTITRRWAAADHCGNSASCEQIIHVVDNVAPTIHCPQNISVSCVQGINPAVTGQATAEDNCDPNPHVSFSDSTAQGTCPAVAVITRTWKARDACGNEATCQQTITLTDPSGPSITCPQDVTINCGESTAPSHTGFATAVDSCDPNPAVTYEDTYSGNCPRIVNRKWTATDAYGNSVNCVQEITVVDLVPPDIICPQNLTLACGADTSTTSTGTAHATDNCDSAPVIAYTDTLSGMGCPRTITRVWTATDKCGNFVTCTQIITVTGSAPCPRTPGYWKNHREAWPVSSLTVGCVTYNETQLMNLLSNKLPNGTNASSDMSAALAKFVISTTFNLMTNSPPGNIQSYLDDAHDFLCNYPPGSNPKGSAKRQGTTLKDKLDAYCNSTPNGCFGD